MDSFHLSSWCEGAEDWPRESQLTTHLDPQAAQKNVWAWHAVYLLTNCANANGSSDPIRMPVLSSTKWGWGDHPHIMSGNMATWTDPQCLILPLSPFLLYPSFPTMLKDMFLFLPYDVSNGNFSNHFSFSHWNKFQGSALIFIPYLFTSSLLTTPLTPFL